MSSGHGRRAAAQPLTLPGLPDTVTTIDVYGWDGLRRSLPVSGARTVILDALAINEISIMHAHKGTPGSGLSKLDVSCPVNAPDHLELISKARGHPL